MSKAFALELEQIDSGLSRRLSQLDELEPNTPHPTCDCGRSLNQHLESEIEALESLRELMEQGNPQRFIDYVQSDGNPMKVPFAITQVWRYADFPQEARLHRCAGTLREMLRAFPELLEIQLEVEVQVIVIEIEADDEDDAPPYYLN